MSSVPPPDGQRPAGWYSVDALTQRYWDGELWTDHVARGGRSAARERYRYPAVIRFFS